MTIKRPGGVRWRKKMEETGYSYAIRLSWEEALRNIGLTELEADNDVYLLEDSGGARHFASDAFWKPGSRDLEGVIISDMKFYSDGRGVHGTRVMATDAAVRTINKGYGYSGKRHFGC